MIQSLGVYQLLKNSGTMQAVDINDGYKLPLEIVINTLAIVAPPVSLVCSKINSSPIELRHGVWCIQGREMISNKLNEDPISMYVYFYDHTENRTMNKISEFRTTADKLSTVIGQSFILLGAAFKTGSLGPQCTFEALDARGDIHAFYSTPNTHNIAKKIDAAKAWPLPVTVISFDSGYGHAGIGFDDPSDSTLKSLTKAFDNHTASESSAEAAPAKSSLKARAKNLTQPKVGKGKSEELDPATGEWKKVKTGKTLSTK